MTEPPLLRPFAGLRPAPGRAAEVIAPPYDVVDADEARRLVAGRPHSFLHISRAEVDLPIGTDPYAPEVYARARANLDDLRAAGVLRRDERPCYYVYRQEVAGRRQTGLVVGASVAAYVGARIKKHELTRPAKEDDRVRQIAALAAQTGPVFLVNRADASLREQLAAICDAAEPDVDVTGADGVRHRLWVVADAARVATLTELGASLPALYVADGHHRSAAAVRVAQARGDAASAAFLAVLFPHDELTILPYHRLVADLGGQTLDALLARVGERFEVAPSATPVQPTRASTFGLYADGRWWRLTLREGLLPAGADPVTRLAVTLLHTHLIEPVLGITDPRRDPRIDFVGGSRGLDGLMAPVDAGAMALALALPATGIDELLAVADADAIMPPKSTWFEPKLADGLVSLLLDPV
jgi:uncharacterized protein (DUF1015 family)